jgi:RTA1 like protein
VTIGFVIVRSIYRLIENLGGFHNHIATSEPTFYSCDTIMLLLFVLTWIIFHPSRLDFIQEGGENAAVSVTPQTTTTTTVTPSEKNSVENGIVDEATFRQQP